MIKVYTGGSSKQNPGPGGAGIVIKNAVTQEILTSRGIPLGHVTNNQAEFLALKHALTGFTSQGPPGDRIKVLTDSQLVVGIFSLSWKARANLELAIEIRSLVKDFPQLRSFQQAANNGYLS